ncbi:unnamed protein product [Dovyalis caffra]|uniref:Uncharacterized protein n=1 Tax=Dovyalis caffra TaxID=77055 RepID=A0AAV1RMM0_9ROSI|nr:unnamed protein product [Dovyalis caffra]
MSPTTKVHPRIPRRLASNRLKDRRPYMELYAKISRSLGRQRGSSSAAVISAEEGGSEEKGMLME